MPDTMLSSYANEMVHPCRHVDFCMSQHYARVLAVDKTARRLSAAYIGAEPMRYRLSKHNAIF